MPLRRFKCQTCGFECEIIKKKTPQCLHGKSYDEISVPEEMVQILVAPKTKMMEKTDEFRGKSKQKGLNKMLKERTRNYARDHEADDMISMNNKNNLKRSGFLTKEGKKRKKIDDL